MRGVKSYAANAVVAINNNAMSNKVVFIIVFEEGARDKRMF